MHSTLIDIEKEVLKMISGLDHSRPILSKELERALDISGPMVRAAIRELRRSGEPIVATEHGYFMATSSKEVDLIVKDLQARFDSLGKTISAIKRRGYERFGMQRVFGFRTDDIKFQGALKGRDNEIRGDSPGQGQTRDLLSVPADRVEGASQGCVRERDVPGTFKDTPLDDLL